MSMKTTLVAAVVSASVTLLPLTTSGAATMQEANAKTFAELVDVVFNHGSIDAADKYFQPSLVDHAPWPGQTADVAGFKAGLAEMRKSFPDFHVTVERTVAEKDMLVVHAKFSGSQLGEFMGAKPSGTKAGFSCF